MADEHKDEHTSAENHQPSEHKTPDNKQLEELLKNAQAQEASNKAHGHEGHGKESKPNPMSPLEEIVHGAGSAVKLGLAGIIPYVHAMTTGLVTDTSVLAGAQVLGDATTSRKRGKKYTAGNALESSIVGTALTWPTTQMFNFVNQIPTNDFLGYAIKGLAWGGLCYPAFLAGYQAIDYLVKNRTFKGLGTYMKKEYVPALKTLTKYLLPFSLLNVFFAPAYLQIPISAALSYLFTLFGAPKKDELKENEKRDKTPYLAAAYSAAGKLGKTISSDIYGSKGVFYGLGSGIRSTLDKYLGPGAGHPAPAGTGHG